VTGTVTGNRLIGTMAAALSVPLIFLFGALDAILPAAAAVPHAVAAPEDQTSDGQWWFRSLDVERSWRSGARGQGMTVAVLDTGVQADRSELSGVVLPGSDFAGGDGRTDHDPEGDGHGTHMAILVAGQGGTSGMVGIAPEARILPGDNTRDSDVAAQIRWAVDKGAKVINMSFGIEGACPRAEAAAVRYALREGAVLVASAGNSRLEGNAVEYPSSCPGVIAVGALDEEDQVWSGSNTGPRLGLAAPGVYLVGVDNHGELGYWDGTSGASALVSAAVALVWSAHPELTNRQVVARLLATAEDLGPRGRDVQSGFGAVRPYQAITADVPAGADNPIFDAAGVGGTSDPSATDRTATSSAPEPGSGDEPGRGAGGDRDGVSGTVLIAVAVGFGLLVLAIIGGAVVLGVRVVQVGPRRAAAPHGPAPADVPGYSLGTVPAGYLVGVFPPTGSIPVPVPGAPPVPGIYPATFPPSGTVPPGPVPSGTVPSGPVPPGTAPSGTVPPDPVPPGTVPSGPVPSGPAPPGTVPPGTAPSGTVPPDPVPPGSTLPTSRKPPAGSIPPPQ
jgi:hypothetical protein